MSKEQKISLLSACVFYVLTIVGFFFFSLTLIILVFLGFTLSITYFAFQCYRVHNDYTGAEHLQQEIGILNAEKVQLKKDYEVLLKAKDEDRRYFEGPWMHKYNGLYYLSYSTGTTHYIVYATSESPTGPFTYRGRIMEPVIGWTTHHSIVEYKGKWLIFYHDCEMSNGINHRRNVKYTELHYNDDGSIVTIDPYK